MRCAVVIVTAFLARSVCADFEVQTLRGKPTAGRLASVTNQQLVVGGKTLAWNDVISVRRKNAKSLAFRAPALFLTGGDVLFGSYVGTADEAIRWKWSPGGDKATITSTIPLEFVRAMVLSIPGDGPASPRGAKFLREVFSTRPKNDILLTATGDRIRGEFDQLEDKSIRVKASAGMLSLPLARLRAVLFNAELLSTSQPKSTHWSVRFAGGSLLRVKAMAYASARFSFTTLGDVKISTPVEAVAEIRTRGGSSVSLSRSKPKSIAVTPFFGSRKRPPRFLSNLAGGPILVGGQYVREGIGVTSRTRITYTVSPNAEALHIAAALDDTAPRTAGVVFRIEVDGKTKYESNPVIVRGKTISIPSIALRGAKQLSLVVDFGPRGDAGDVAAWIEPTITHLPKD